jgi:uncharacterized protein (DUF608 family)
MIIPRLGPLLLAAALLSHGQAEDFASPEVLARLNTEAGPAVPTVKGLDPAWVRALPLRGEPAAYTRANSADFAYLGMPIGGVGCGQVYLAGDGRLWCWDIFNTYVPSANFPNEQGAAFLKPPRSDDPKAKNTVHFEQGFTLKVVTPDKTWERPLDRDGFRDITFTGGYPVGFVAYRDAEMPVVVDLQAFSPFIPLNLPDSSLPATVLRYTVRNTSAKPVEVTLSGRLQNAVLHNAAAQFPNLRNAIVSGPGFSFLECSAETEDDAVKRTPAYGTMGLALLGPAPELSRPRRDTTPANATAAPVGEIGRVLRLSPGGSATMDFVLAWNFPNLDMPRIGKGRDYAGRFADARAVAAYVSENYERLVRDTLLWKKTWDDSSLPHWFLDQVFAAVSGLASSTSYLMSDGRFYAYEGIYSCPGTCTHVYHYNQASGRLFPALERKVREDVDLGVAFDAKSGVIGFRAEYDRHLAVDGQAGTILRIYREHLASPDDAFLRRVWPRVKKSFDPLLALDPDGDGILEGAQMNTLDKPWFGRVAWLSSLYLAALRAGERMATICDDPDFAARCRDIAGKGYASLPRELFEDGYFINRVDPAKPDSINSGTGCHIDQVMGQSWAFQVGLPRVLPPNETRSALRSLWKYNFTSKMAPYRELNKPGRWYADKDQGGLLMCTFPRSDWSYDKAKGKGPDWAAGYFNEAMTGFEHQVAAHMLWEGLAPEALAIERAIAERYQGDRRNPWNEIENGSHYGRAMASYGVFLAASGYDYDGPRRHLGFAPKLTPDDFKVAFTAAEGWGSYQQKSAGRDFVATVNLAWGNLPLRTLALAALATAGDSDVRAQLDEHPIKVTTSRRDGQLVLTFDPELRLTAGQHLTVTAPNMPPAFVTIAK